MKDMEKEISNALAEVNPQLFKSLIHEFRGTLVMLDSDLAAIYGYSTKDFNRQVKNNREKFAEDFMFQLTKEEADVILRCKNFTSSLVEKDSRSGYGGRRYCPYAFTEQGIYMLMTVLRGELATKQSIALIRLFKGMKDFILENQPLLGQREYLQLSLQTTENIRDIVEIRSSLAKLDDKVAKMADDMGKVVTQSELSDIMLDFSNPVVRRGWLILRGQPVESDLAYQQIYSAARKSVIVYDNYISLKTLVLMKNISAEVSVTVVTDNVQGKLSKAELEDYTKEYPDVRLRFLKDGGTFHDRYIVIDYCTPDEEIYHCGASSKDGGNKVMTIEPVSERAIYHQLIDESLTHDALVFK